MLKKKILIFGGSGLLGYHCVQHFSKKYRIAWTYNEPINQDLNSIHYSYEKNDKNIDKIILSERFLGLIIGLTSNFFAYSKIS